MELPKTFSVTSSIKIIALKIKVNDIETNAIIDTGATKSAISCKLAERIKLLERGTIVVTGVHSKTIATKYMATISLPNEIIFRDTTLIGINSIGGFDVLIGMDILTKGNFAVSVANGKTYFSYKTPPDGKIICFE